MANEMYQNSWFGNSEQEGFGSTYNNLNRI